MLQESTRERQYNVTKEQNMARASEYMHNLAWSLITYLEIHVGLLRPRKS